MGFISDNIAQNIKPSVTFLVDAKAKELKEKGIKIINLGIGEPDFDTPDNIKAAAIDAINKGYTKYMESGGTKKLREAVINKLKQEHNLEYDINEICVSSGTKQVIYNALMATINPGDEVIIPAPFWVSYPEMVKIANGTPVIVDCEDYKDFSVNIAHIEKAITNKTKWIIINSPNNPSGYVYDQKQIKELANLLIRHKHVHILSDDIYEQLLYEDEKTYNIVELEPQLKNRVLLVSGVSKTYAMTGWRLGYGAGEKQLIKAMALLQTQSTAGACSISQMAAIEALNGSQNIIKERNLIYKKRRDQVFEQINQIRGLKTNKPRGAFYFFVDCSELFGKKTPQGVTIKNSQDVANYLLEQAHVVVVMGSAFGMEGFFRLAYTTDEENLKEACLRIKKACEMLGSA